MLCALMILCIALFIYVIAHRFIYSLMYSFFIDLYVHNFVRLKYCGVAGVVLYICLLSRDIVAKLIYMFLFIFLIPCL